MISMPAMLNTSTLKNYKMFSIVLLLGASQIVNSAYAEGYVSAANQIGIVIVNEKNGNISFCNGVFKLSGFNMTGRCRNIGSIPTVLLQGNVSITLPESTSLNKYYGSNAFILNTTTGVVVICPAFVNGSTGAQVGVCLPPTQAP